MLSASRPQGLGLGPVDSKPLQEPGVQTGSGFSAPGAARGTCGSAWTTGVSSAPACERHHRLFLPGTLVPCTARLGPFPHISGRKEAFLDELVSGKLCNKIDLPKIQKSVLKEMGERGGPQELGWAPPAAHSEASRARSCSSLSGSVHLEARSP